MPERDSRLEKETETRIRIVIVIAKRAESEVVKIKSPPMQLRLGEVRRTAMGRMLIKDKNERIQDDDLLVLLMNCELY